jgi:hypothetical protein
MIRVLLYCCIISIFACDGKEKPGTIVKLVVTKTGNVSFTFLSKGYAYDNRVRFMEECHQAIKSNIALLNLAEYRDSIRIQFLSSREEMKRYTGMTPSGIALPDSKIVYIVANGNPKEVKPPIKHELMHLISMTTWGFPAPDSNWMNEGLAAYAENNCNGYNDEQIYRYLISKGMLISMDSLATTFYHQPEMVSYHQAAYIVEYLLSQFGVQKFKNLWAQGFRSFEKIYGIRFEQVQKVMNNTAENNYPIPPNIDWNSFKAGCF